MAYSVLVVEDDKDLREMVCLMLEYSGFDVRSAVDGVDGLARLASEQPDLIILDVMMPRMDGITMCRHVRETPEMAELPIILMSGKTQEEAITDGLTAGANRYLRKPMSLDLLVQNIQDLLP